VSLCKAAVGGEAARARNPARRSADLDPLGLLGVADRPAQSLDELHGRVIGAEMHRVHTLVEQQQGVPRLGLICSHDNSRHEFSFLDALLVRDRSV
jgi:hypothetical protein